MYVRMYVLQYINAVCTMQCVNVRTYIHTYIGFAYVHTRGCDLVYVRTYVHIYACAVDYGLSCLIGRIIIVYTYIHTVRVYIVSIYIHIMYLEFLLEVVKKYDCEHWGIQPQCIDVFVDTFRVREWNFLQWSIS